MFNNLLSKIGVDKVLHFLVCFIISENVAMFAFMMLLMFRPYNGWATHIGAGFIGVVFTFLVGFAKERYDETQEGNHFDIEDTYANSIGAVLGAVVGIALTSILTL